MQTSITQSGVDQNLSADKPRGRRVATFLLILFVCWIAVAVGQTFQDKIQQGVALLESGNLSEARTLLEALVRQEPSHPRVFIANQLLGRISLYERSYESGYRYFDWAVQQAPQFTPALVGRARASLFLDQIDNGRTDLQKATAGSGKAPEAELLLAELLLMQNQQAEARTVLDAMTASRAEGYARAADLLLAATTNKEAAKEKLLAAFADNLGKPEAYLALGYYYRANAQDERASTLFEVASHMDDQNPVAWLLSGKPQWNDALTQLAVQQLLAAGETNLKQSNYDVAVEALNRILQARPMHVPAQMLLVETAEKQNNIWAALWGYQRIMQLIPELPEFPIRLGKLATSVGAHGVAECAFRRTIELSPGDPSLHYLIATALAAQGKVDAAIESCNKAIAGGFHAAPVYVALGNLYYEKMQMSESISALSRAVEMDPKAAETIASFALSALTTEDYAKLRKLLEQHISANPDSVNTLYGLAVMNLNEGRLQEAAAHLSHLEALAPDSPQVHYNLALLYGRQGDPQKASEAMTRFQKLKKAEQEEWQRQNEAFRTRILAGEALEARNSGKAIELLNSLVQEEIAGFEDHLNLGRAYLLAQNAQRAQLHLEKALALKPFDPEALQEAAKISVQYNDRLKLLKQLCDENVL